MKIKFESRTDLGLTHGRFLLEGTGSFGSPLGSVGSKDDPMDQIEGYPFV
jgi:hypothetical protein